MDKKQLFRLQDTLGYRFNDMELLIEAFTHASVADERLQSNERLEFLGDSILGLVICKKLFDQFPEYLEGDLTKIKSMLVSRKTCARIVNDINLTDFVKVGKGMESTKAISGSIAAGIFESIIAAIYIDGGFESAQDFILKMYESLLETVDADSHHENFKSLLQQTAQRIFAATPIYELLDEKGPDHNKCFEVDAIIGHRHFPSAWGHTKKEAEQNAAYKALIELEIIQPEKK
jgi:ribonuclease-3